MQGKGMKERMGRRRKEGRGKLGLLCGREMGGRCGRGECVVVGWGFWILVASFLPVSWLQVLLHTQ